ncbi:hypothetical protein ACFFX0_24495 [Citricoccus parietis]|uniref:Uncharacterized protein n=1 Tax=Citricoccus parietis TaxID=592307 RepID=A0ABV5G5J5_9MICC
MRRKETGRHRRSPRCGDLVRDVLPRTVADDHPDLVDAVGRVAAIGPGPERAILVGGQGEPRGVVPIDVHAGVVGAPAAAVGRQPLVRVEVVQGPVRVVTVLVRVVLAAGLRIAKGGALGDLDCRIGDGTRGGRRGDGVTRGGPGDAHLEGHGVAGGRPRPCRREGAGVVHRGGVDLRRDGHGPAVADARGAGGAPGELHGALLGCRLKGGHVEGAVRHVGGHRLRRPGARGVGGAHRELVAVPVGGDRDGVRGRGPQTGPAAAEGVFVGDR